MALRSVSYFRERDQGHDRVHHGDRDRGRGEVGQGIINRILSVVSKHDLVNFYENVPYAKWKFLAPNTKKIKLRLFLRGEEWFSYIRRSVLFPCMLIIDYCRVVSVTVGGPECSDNGQDIDNLQKFCRIRCKSDAHSRRG